MGEYRRGTKADIENILDFADMVFSMSSGSTDFEEILPKAYSGERSDVVMHHMICEEGTIRALIDVYPETLEIDGQFLKCAYIGTVSVHHKSRGKGYMIELMDKAEEDLRAQGFDMLILDGSRKRYQHYGFEKSGIKYCFNLTENSIRNSGIQETDTSGLHFELIENEDDELLDTIYGFYQKRHVIIRDRESFYLCTKSWSADLYAVVQKEQCIGYLNVSADGASVYEIGLAQEQMLPAVLAVYMSEMDIEELGVNVGMDEMDKIPFLDEVSDYYTMSMSHQIKILDYEHTLTFLFLWKRQYSTLADGHYVVGIEEAGVQTCYKIDVSGKNICVEQTTEAPDAVFDRLSLVRKLTTGYYYAAVLDEKEALRNAPSDWFPLPFFLPEADAF